MKKGKKKHTGRIRHADMHMLMDGHGSNDPHADPMHNKMNKQHGTCYGCSPQGDYGDGEEGATLGLTGGNSEYS
jgi:hypothetical protein